MADEIFLPTKEALGDFGLTRTATLVDAKNNPFIKAPGTNQSNTAEGFLNEVILHAFEYQPVKITTDNSGDVPKVKMDFGGSSQPPVIAKYRILLKNQPSFEGKHEWSPGAKGMMDFFYNAVNKAPETLAVATSVINNIGTYVAGGDNFEVPSNRRTDYQYTYSETAYQQVSLNFELITNNNFIRDIYNPIMDLMSLTYPKRYANDAEGNVLNAATDAVGQAPQAVNEQFSLTARQYTLKPPCLFNIYHQSGLYSYSNCHCAGFTVNYDGPWYNASAEELSQFNILKGQAPSVQMQTRSFPSVAKISMQFKSGERMFRDDFKKIRDSFNQIINNSKTTFSQFES
jgi:hypothetical protein